jgi:hypothetical protein
MTDSELEQRKARAATETLVIAPTEGGFRVYNPANITRLYMVSVPDAPKCNCPDFEAHKSDPEWRCKHILAVLNQMEKRAEPKPSTENSNQTQTNETESKPSEPAEKKKTRLLRNGQHSQMIIKRSVSPDGRINSMSVKFSYPIDVGSDDELKQRAEKALKVQAEIVSEFLNRNGSRRSDGQPQGKPKEGASPDSKTQSGSTQPANGTDGAVPAQLLNIAGMNTRNGWKLFINVQVNGTTTKLFGNKRQLGEYIAAAGFASMADHVNQGMMLNLPCRVVTKRSQDGKYPNIERVLPIQPLEDNRRGGQ